VADRTILIATGNAGKLREMQAMLDGLPVRWLGLGDVGHVPEPVEDGSTFLANAERKALHYASLTDHWTLAEDSGLEVDCLDGRPGVYSARFAGPQRSDRDNNAKLVEMVRAVPPDRRSARFRCVMVMADPHRVLLRSEGLFEGLILTQPRGRNGFGYDPHFFIPRLAKTAAELPPEQKNAISHRGQALQAIRPRIQALLQSAARFRTGAK